MATAVADVDGHPLLRQAPIKRRSNADQTGRPRSPHRLLDARDKPRFGFDGLLVPSGEKAPTLQRILELRDAGCGAYKTMTPLNAEGTANPRTRDVWRLGTMQSVLRTLERTDVRV